MDTRMRRVRVVAPSRSPWVLLFLSCLGLSGLPRHRHLFCLAQKEEQCAGHMVKSFDCGANAGKYSLPCCSGHACDGRFCVDMETAGGGNQTALLLEAEALRPKEREVLVRLYEETGGGKWNRNGGWLEDGIDQCRWEGVTCTEYGLVAEITLGRNNMVGRLFDLAASLTYLHHIDMHANQLEASLPSDFRLNHSNLRYIDLSKNKLTGNLSDKSSIHESLLYLDLSTNLIMGRFEPKFDLMKLCPPSSNETLADLTAGGINSNAIGNATDPPCGPNLAHIALGSNQIAFVNVTHFTSLRHLDLSKNAELEQPLAALGIGNLMFLENLTLAKSRLLAGDLRIGHMSYLHNVDLSGMALSGDIGSTGIMNITTLRSIDLSGGNKFIGLFDFCDMVNLTSLSLAGQNSLSGNLTDCENIGSMQHLDLSDNEFSGGFQLFGSPISLQHVNLHRNAFTGTLPDFELMQGIEYLHVGENLFSGTLPDLSMPLLKDLNVSYNGLTGNIPTSITNLVVLETLDLSNQANSVYDSSTGIRVTRGLRGQIPLEIGQVSFLQKLFLQNNILTGTMPESLARLTYLGSLNLEDNFIGGEIPSSINILEQLGNVMLARNRLTGEIPDLGGSVDNVRTVTMSGNPELIPPAPFKLCDLDELDLRSDSSYCPAERSVLATFYAECFGTEWLDNTNWLTEKHHCEWFGVTCDENYDHVLKLELKSNGVAGRIPEALFKLTSLTHLDLNDNDMRGEIPESISDAKALQWLRLSYNRLTKLPDSISNLTNLALVHLQNNRMEGDASVINLLSKRDIPKDLLETLPPHRFISDCGDPQDVSDSFVCLDCDMCCNALEECNVPVRQRFPPWLSTMILLICCFVGLSVVWWIIRILTTKRILSEPGYSAIESAGEESVYFFFLADSKVGWLVTVATLFVQIAIFGLFLSAASFDNGDGDFVYSWRCPLNTPECNDERAVTAYGWVMWAFLVTAALLDDLIRGCRLLFLSSTRGSTKCFISGMSLVGIIVLAIYCSFFYNQAIAMSNTELIVNSVILLFVNEFDEQVHGIVGILKSRWLEEVQEEAESFSEQLCHEHVQVSMMTNIDEKEDDSPGDANKSSVYGANASGMRPSSKVNVGSQEEVTRLLQSMQNRIEVLERNAGFQSPPAPQAGDHEEDDGPITQGTSSCTIQ